MVKYQRYWQWGFWYSPLRGKKVGKKGGAGVSFKWSWGIKGNGLFSECDCSVFISWSRLESWENINLINISLQNLQEIIKSDSLTSANGHVCIAVGTTSSRLDWLWYLPHNVLLEVVIKVVKERYNVFIFGDGVFTENKIKKLEMECKTSKTLPLLTTAEIASSDWEY